MLASLLRPPSTRVVPLPVLLLIFGGFLLLVGPADWLLLGRTRRRLWTWLSFPLIAAAATGATALAANHFLGSNLVHTQLTVSDLGPDGRLIREWQIGYWISPRTRDHTIDCTGELHEWQASHNDGDRSCEGSPPGRYTSTARLARWSPRLSSSLRIAPGEDRSGIAWEKCDPRRVAQQHRVTHEFIDALVEKNGVVIGFCAHTHEGIYSDGPQLHILRSLLNGRADRTAPALLSRLSPAGGVPGSAILLPAADSPRHATASVLLREGGDFHLYRRLYLYPTQP